MKIKQKIILFNKLSNINLQYYYNKLIFKNDNKLNILLHKQIVLLHKQIVL